MLLGSMNNPHNDLMKEVGWILKRFDFLDLTLEMPMAHPKIIKVRELKAVITKTVVGHTAPYLPIGAAEKGVRMGAVAEFEKCLDVFERLGVQKANVHFDGDDVEANIW
ncbi:MAG TPA: sugar phosphate isomerase/epimerase, partial [archaeon]|nr:sugar phosphate isomerase/epimerase [archaeon]